MPSFRADATPGKAWPRPVTNEEGRVTGPAVAPSTCGHTRRAAVRFLSACALAGPAALRSPSARAIKGWCRRDPIVKIGDLTVQIVLISDTAMHGLATGPTQLVIQAPAGIATRFVADDPGFGRYGYDVRFVESRDLMADGRSIDVQLDAYAPAVNPAAGPLPLLLELTPRGNGGPVVVRAEGRANEWVSLRANLAALDLGESDDTPPAGPPLSPEEESDTTPPAAGHDTKARKKHQKGRGKKKSP